MKTDMLLKVRDRIRFGSSLLETLAVVPLCHERLAPKKSMVFNISS